MKVLCFNLPLSSFYLIYLSGTLTLFSHQIRAAFSMQTWSFFKGIEPQKIMFAWWKNEKGQHWKSFVHVPLSLMKNSPCANFSLNFVIISYYCGVLHSVAKLYLIIVFLWKKNLLNWDDYYEWGSIIEKWISRGLLVPFLSRRSR